MKRLAQNLLLSLLSILVCAALVEALFRVLDRGPEGLDATLNVLQQNGILQHGTVASQAGGQPRPAYLPITLARGGASVKIGFLSFSWGTNGIPDPYQQVNLLWDSA